jgi:hypothetical protein
MEINMEAMLKQQAKRLVQINGEKPMAADDIGICKEDYYKDTVSATHIIGEVEGRLVITRYIDMKVRKVSFDMEVKFADVMVYFSVADGMFLRLCDRKHLEI